METLIVDWDNKLVKYVIFSRPCQVWVLDATPGRVRAGLDEEDHPAELIAALKKMPKIVPDR
jgi:hypothetical protein